MYDEDGDIVGINGMVQRHGQSISKFKDDIHVVISDNIDPVPECDMFSAHIDGQDVLVIKVNPDYTKCYTVRMSKEVSVYSIRRGATTRIADNNEVQELVRLRTITQTQTKSPFDGYRFSQE